jgi:signal transduction histidine kinase
VLVDVIVTAGELAVAVVDDGVGPGEVTRSSGIANLRARAEKWRGSFTVVEGPSGGTAATWRVQLG